MLRLAYEVGKTCVAAVFIYTGFVPVLENVESHGICVQVMELDLANMYAAELPTVLDCPKYTPVYMRGNTLNYGNIYIYYEVVLSAIAGIETILSP